MCLPALWIVSCTHVLCLDLALYAQVHLNSSGSSIQPKDCNDFKLENKYADNLTECMVCSAARTYRPTMVSPAALEWTIVALYTIENTGGLLDTFTGQPITFLAPASSNGGWENKATSKLTATEIAEKFTDFVAAYSYEIGSDRMIESWIDSETDILYLSVVSVLLGVPGRFRTHCISMCGKNPMFHDSMTDELTPWQVKRRKKMKRKADQTLNRTNGEIVSVSLSVFFAS